MAQVSNLRYLAMDKNSKWYAYVSKPELRPHGWFSPSDGDVLITIQIEKLEDFTQSLTEAQ